MKYNQINVIRLLFDAAHAEAIGFARLIFANCCNFLAQLVRDPTVVAHTFCWFIISCQNDKKMK